MSQSQRGGLLMFIMGSTLVVLVAVVAGGLMEPIDHFIFILGVVLWGIGGFLFVTRDDSLHMSTIDNQGESVYNVDRETLHSPPFSGEVRLPRAGLAALSQPPPQPGGAFVADYVLQDITDRVAAGEERYGTKLQAFNGRDALWDAYQEAIDMVFYLRQAIIEREAP